MKGFERSETPRRRSRPNLGTPLLGLAILMLASPLAAETEQNRTIEHSAVAGDASADNDDVFSLATYNVTADRVEDFGLRVTSSFYSRQPKTTAGFFLSKFAPIITAVLPNTAAAKAGLEPGERVLKSEGKSTVGGLFSTGKLGKWHKTQAKKWAEVAAGKANVTWTLEVESPVTRAVRIVKLKVPTPPPHWGASAWRAPEGRRPSTVMESGPLAARSREILDHGIWTLLEGDVAQTLGVDVPVNPSGFPCGLEPKGFRWHIGGREGLHQIFVTQFRGRTDVLLETNSPATGRRVYLTSPSGKLERAWQWTRKEKTGEVPLDEEVRIGFEHELDFWTARVERSRGRWPFKITPGYDPNAIFAVLTPRDDPPAAQVVRSLAKDFLKLRRATEREHALFTEAYGKIGVDQNAWAYTETSRGLEDKRVIVTRIDPSRPNAERCVLLSIDGKPPTSDDVQRWRDDGGDLPKPLGDIPPLAGIVDLKELRVFEEDSAAIIFELPMQRENPDFPAEKFQALFRVNRTHRTFEEIAVKLRDTFRVAGMVKVIDAGLEIRFQTLDPAQPPQPVYLKAGGGVRVLFVKLSRSFEATRTDFVRVQPFDDTTVLATDE